MHKHMTYLPSMKYLHWNPQHLAAD